MKKIVIFAILFFLGSIPQELFAFNDIENNWYKDSISDLESEGIVQGFSDGGYHPHDYLTRAEVLKLLFQANDIVLDATDLNCFSDISNTDWQAKYVCSAVEKWFAKGYEDETFRPNEKVTVIEMLAFAQRIYGFDLSTYEAEGEWYEKYQNFADENALFPIFSYTKDTYISRGQAAELLVNFEKYSQGEKISSLSSACGLTPELKSGEYSLVVDGVTRKYLLYVPSGVSASSAKWLIVAFHGRTNSNDDVRDYMVLGWGSYGNTKNQQDFIVAYPAGTGSGPYSWAGQENIDFFDALITEVSSKLCIDRKQIFTVGHSLWSYMSNKISCVRGDVVRGMVGVAGGKNNVECSWPVSSLILHLPWDYATAYSEWVAAYSKKIEQNQCTGEEKTISMGNIKWCVQQASCSSGNTVIFCNSYEVYGWDSHSWPKNGSDEILDFLKNING